MKVYNRYAVLAALIVVIVAVGLYGCSRPQETDQAAAPADGEADEHAGHDHAEKADEPPELPDPIDDAKKRVTDTDPDEAIQSVQTLAGLLTNEDPKMVKDAVEILSGVAKSSEHRAVRAEAIKALSTIADAVYLLLEESVSDPDETVWRAAIAALGQSSKGSPGESLLRQLVKSDKTEIASLATSSLKALEEGGAENPLATAVASLGIPDGDASAQAAIQLKLAGTKAIPLLEEAIRTSKRASQRHAATMCVALICAGTNPRQEQFAATVHATRKEKDEPPPSNLKALPILAYAINDPDPATREIAAQGMGYLGDKRAAEYLAKALKDPDVHVRRRAASALITTPADSVESEVIDAALRDNDEKVRRFAVEALGWIGGTRAVNALMRASRDGSAEVRRYVAQQLGRIAEPASLQALVHLYEDAREREKSFADPRKQTQEQDVRWAAVQAVAALRDRDSVDLLVTALNDPVSQVANAAEAGLQKLGVAKRRIPGMD